MSTAPSRHRIPTLLALLIVCGAGICPDNPSGGSPMAPASTTIVGVNTRTEGADPDPDGYVVELGSRTQPVAVNGQISFRDVDPGSHSLGLGDVADNCTVASVTPPGGSPLTQNPITVSATEGSNRFYNFRIVCSANVGQLILFNDTEGDPGLTAYRAEVTHGGVTETYELPLNTNVYVDVTSGAVRVELTNLPSHCLLIGSPSRTAEVPRAGGKTVAFYLDCTGTVGALRVTTRSTGESVDPDGYLVRADGLTIGFSNDPSFSHDFGFFAPGHYEVWLFNVAPNCVADPVAEVPLSVEVVANQTTEQVFEIACSGTGSVSVDITTNGEGLDPDGYLLTVAGTTRRVPVNPIASQVFASLAPGQVAQVELSDVAANCSVQEANPQTVTVVLDAVTAAPGFTVDCVSEGSLQVTTVTTGGAPPDDGFGLSFGGQTYAIGINETLDFPGLPTGDLEVRLIEETQNCTITAPNPRTVTIALNETVATTFETSCPSPTPPIIFESNRDGDFDIYAIDENGEGLVNLTNNGWNDIDPSWSWDNTKIIFVSDEGGQSDIWTMDPDGSNRTRITNNAAVNEDPEFSPDGTRIAYEQQDPDDGSLELWIADADGSNPVQLTDDGGPGISEAPHFHPDGTEILFKSDRDGDFDIYLMDADGSNLRQLTNTSVQDFDATWHPNGLQIVFSSERATATYEDIWIMDRNGDGLTPLVTNNVWDWHPVYSSDGSKIVFTSDRFGDYDLFIMNANGTGVTPLFTGAGRDTDAEFKKPIF